MSVAATTGADAAPQATPPAVQRAAGRCSVSGDATLATAARLRSAGQAAFAAATGEVVVDLSGVQRADSAGLAVLIDWLAWAQTAGRRLSFIAVPTAILALARLSNVEDLLQGPAVNQ